MVVRKIVSKLMRRLSIPFVTKIMPEQHRAIITYIEKEKRKAENRKERDRLLALLGQT